MLHYGSQEASRVEAPTGVVYLAFTDVEYANNLWDSAPMAMLEAISMYYIFTFLIL